MKLRWLLIVFSLLILFTGCGEIKKPINPKYQFKLGETLFYKLSAKVSVSMDGGFIRYNGDIEATADVEMTAVDTNQYGYKIMMDIKNPDIKGGDGKFINLGFYAALNYIRTYFATFYLTENGNATVLFDDKPVEGFNAYAQILFPDLSDQDKLFSGITDSKNYPAKFQNTDYVMTIQRYTIAQNSRDNILPIQQQIKFITFQKDDFTKSVEPQPIGTITVNFKDQFNLLKGQMTEKDGDLQVGMNLPLKQDFLTIMIMVQGKGTISMTQVAPSI